MVDTVYWMHIGGLLAQVGWFSLKVGSHLALSLRFGGFPPTFCALYKFISLITYLYSSSELRFWLLQICNRSAIMIALYTLSLFIIIVVIIIILFSTGYAVGASVFNDFWGSFYLVMLRRAHCYAARSHLSVYPSVCLSVAFRPM